MGERERERETVISGVRGRQISERNFTRGIGVER